jgi:hypothetical protein
MQVNHIKSLVADGSLSGMSARLNGAFFLLGRLPHSKCSQPIILILYPAEQRDI